MCVCVCVYVYTYTEYCSSLDRELHEGRHWKLLCSIDVVRSTASSPAIKNNVLRDS